MFLLICVSKNVIVNQSLISCCCLQHWVNTCLWSSNTLHWCVVFFLHTKGSSKGPAESACIGKIIKTFCCKRTITKVNPCHSLISVIRLPEQKQHRTLKDISQSRNIWGNWIYFLWRLECPWIKNVIEAKKYLMFWIAHIGIPIPIQEIDGSVKIPIFKLIILCLFSRINVILWDFHRINPPQLVSIVCSSENETFPSI